MYEDSCPNCGYRKKPYLMASSTDIDYKDIWNGLGGRYLQIIARCGGIILFALILVEILHLLSIYL